MSETTQARIHLTLLFIAAVLLAFSLGAVARIGADIASSRSRPAVESPER